MARFQLTTVIVSFFCLMRIITTPVLGEGGPGDDNNGCDCMEYWACIMRGGSPYSYCGLSESNVCCLVPQDAKAQDPFAPSIAADRLCGRKGIHSGRDGVADPGEWPWHAAILEKPDELYICGGALVGERWVLTAAHCVDDYGRGKGSALKVRLGEYDVTSTTEDRRHEEYDVMDIVLHPLFNNYTLTHDLALLLLQQPVQRRPHIGVVCLPADDALDAPSPTEKCFITGWGRRSEVSEHSLVLKEVRLPLWQNAVCEEALQQHFGRSYTLPNSSLCAGTEGRDACDGDGGGPLVCEDHGQWFQIGVISFGIGCGRRNTPGVYSRVSVHVSWIKNVMTQHT